MLGSYNTTPQATTGVSPAELLHGRQARTKLNIQEHPKLNQSVQFSKQQNQHLQARVKILQQRQKGYADKRRAARESQLKPNDMVRIRKPQVEKRTAKIF